MVEMLIVQSGIFRYDPMNNRSRKLIPISKIDVTTTFEKLNMVSGGIREQMLVVVIIHASLK